MKKILGTFFVVAIVGWLVFLFLNSSEGYADSNMRSYYFLKKLNINNGEITYETNVLIRKLAHLFEFMVLAIILIIIFKLFSFRKSTLCTTTLFLIILIGTLDEFYQSFIPGRSSLVSDVLIDTLGGVLAVILYLFIAEIRYLIKKRKALSRSKHISN